MGYFDGLVSVSFKKRNDGKTIFYPYGRAGYILSEDSEKKAKDFLKRYYVISIFAIIVLTILFKMYALISLIFICPYYFFNIKKFIVNSERVTQRTALEEKVKRMAVSMGLPMCILMLLGSLLMTSISIFAIFSSEVRLVGVLGTLLFGLGLIQSVFLVKYSSFLSKKK